MRSNAKLLLLNNQQKEKRMDLEFIFSEIYDFCKQVERCTISDSTVRKCIEQKSLHMSEIITIVVHFQYSGYKDFKTYYMHYVTKYLGNEFHNIPSYTRFVELKNQLCGVVILCALYLNHAQTNGISIIDSFSIEVCHNKRASGHKTLKLIAAKGKTSMGWFYGLKLHCIINIHGEICALTLTRGNVADNNRDILTYLTKNIFGKLIGDKGYIINHHFYRELFERGTQIITKIRKNMKKPLYTTYDALLLKKRGLIESVGNILKKVLTMEHSRHRSINGFFLNVFSCLIAYALRPKKPSLAHHSLQLP
jgi:hypothetical protein